MGLGRKKELHRGRRGGHREHRGEGEINRPRFMIMLSETEKKMVKKLRKREAFLRRWRWFLAIVHGGILAGAFYILVKVANFPDEPMEGKALVVAYFTGPVLLLMVMGAGWLGYLIANWNGNAKTVLLLKLIEDRGEKE